MRGFKQILENSFKTLIDIYEAINQLIIFIIWLCAIIVEL